MREKYGESSKARRKKLGKGKPTCNGPEVAGSDRRVPSETFNGCALLAPHVIYWVGPQIGRGSKTVLGAATKPSRALFGGRGDTRI